MMDHSAVKYMHDHSFYADLHDYIYIYRNVTAFAINIKRVYMYLYNI